MTQPQNAVIALARAYSLSELFPVEDPRIREELEEAAGRLEGPLMLRPEDGTLLAGGAGLPDTDGSVSELARDLELAGVAEIRLPADVDPATLVTFVRSLRQGSGAGDGGDTARSFSEDLREIEVVFAERGPERAGAARSVSGLFEGGDRRSAGGVAEPGTRQRPAGVEEAAPEPGATPGEEKEGEEEVDEGKTGAEEDAADPAVSELEDLTDRYVSAPPDERAALEEELRSGAEEAESAWSIEELAGTVRRLALHATSGDGDAEALRLARDLLKPSVAARLALEIGGVRDEDRRDALVEATAELGGEMGPAIGEALADTGDRAARRTYIQAMVALGDDARPEVETMLEDSRWFVVRNGVRILGEIGTEDDIEHLTSPLAHADPRVRRETVRSLAKIGGEDAVMLLQGMVDDADPDVRAAVATALGALGEDRAVKLLLQRLEKEEAENTQVQILRALGGLGDPGAVPAIEKRAVAGFFNRPPRPVRIAAYRALASIGTPHAMELLREAVEDRDEEVRNAVRSALSDREG